MFCVAPRCSSTAHRACDLADALDGLADCLDRVDRFLGRKLHARDLATDFLGRLGGLSGELLTSWATTAKPGPASPALAASIVAFSANSMICSAIEAISFTTSPVRAPGFESLVIL
jgi:hypothetical protein